MGKRDGLRVAVTGLGFGAEFVPIYLDHPDVAEVAICDLQPERLAAVGERFGIRRRFESVDDLLADDSIDAVHLPTSWATSTRRRVR